MSLSIPRPFSAKEPTQRFAAANGLKYDDEMKVCNPLLKNTPFLQQIKKLGNVLLPKRHALIVDDQTGHAHDAIGISQCGKCFRSYASAITLSFIEAIFCAAATRSGHIVHESDTSTLMPRGSLMAAMARAASSSIGCPEPAAL